MNQTDAQPLVTVGVPTYNRPAQLDVALGHIARQTYGHLDIIISDNASTDTEVQGVISAWKAQDHRIRSFTQRTSLGAPGNFTFVLMEARGPFFLWMADDDRIEPWYVDRCLEAMREHPKAVLVAPEAQYFDVAEDPFPFLSEGLAFREPVDGGPVARMEHMLRYNYGNLVYGLFRREALMTNRSENNPVLASMNEIAILLEAANAGQVLSLPSIGLHKRAPRHVYDQVIWEIRGGTHPTGAMLSPRSILGTWKYHQVALVEIMTTIDKLGLDKVESKKLKTAARTRLHQHFLQLLVGRKAPHAPRKK